jgi:hypothetical protein
MISRQIGSQNSNLLSNLLSLLLSFSVVGCALPWNRSGVAEEEEEREESSWALRFSELRLSVCKFPMLGAHDGKDFTTRMC